LNPDETTAEEERLAALLAAYDDSLAAGVPPPDFDDGPTSIQPRLQEDLACLQLLNQLRPQPPLPSPTSSTARHDGPEPVSRPDGEPDDRYTLTRLHAVGGIGQVWLAYDAALGREVALKELRPERAEDPSFGARFLHEARVTGQLQHPGIVPVYEMVRGTPDPNASSAEEQPFYTMRFVQGRTLTEATQTYHAKRQAGTAGPLDLIALLNAFVSVCHTVAYAHSRGVIHRDLKGQNVVLGDYGEVIVLDWGFAKLVGAPDDAAPGLPAGPLPSLPDHTLHGQVIGTPAYMAPEQAAGNPGEIDCRTDVYGLGAILYEILTGRPPFTGADAAEVLRQARHGTPPCPRDVSGGVPPALEAVCLRALARRPAERYASAAELARDVQHWLGDEPVTAYREPPAMRLRRWARRHQPIVAGVAALVLTAAVALVCSAVLIGHERTRTAELRARADAQARRELETHLYFQRIALAERELDAHNISRATQLLALCPPHLQGWEWHCLNRLCHTDLLTLHGHAAAVACVAFSPDGRHLASASHDQTIKVWDVAAGGRELFTLHGHTDAVYGLAYSPDGGSLASASWDRTVKVWDLSLGQPGSAAPAAILTFRGHTDAVLRLAYSPDGRRLASLGADRQIKVWDPATGRELQTFPDAEGFYGLAFSPNGQLLAATSQSRTVRVWNLATGTEVMTLRGHKEFVKPVVFSPDGRLLATGAGDLARNEPGEVKVWDGVTGRELRSLPGHTLPVFALAFSPDGRRLVSASQDTTIKLWDVATGQEALTLRGHADTVRSVAFSPDGLRLATASADRTIKVWSAAPWADDNPAYEVRTLRGHEDRVFGVAFGPTGERLASVSNDYVIKVWDAALGRELHSHRVPTAQSFTVAFSLEGDCLATGGNDGVVLLLDATTGGIRRRFSGHRAGPIKGLAFSPDGRRLASGSWDRTLRIWDVASGQPVHTLLAHAQPILGLAYSSDGRWLATASYDQTVKVWDAVRGEEIRTLHGHASRVQSVAFSPDGRHLASASNDGTVRLWDAMTWEEVRTLRGHAGGINCVAYSPDGQRLATASTDRTLKVWDAATGSEIRTLRGHTDIVQWVAFSPDGRRLASAGSDRTVKTWKLPLAPAVTSPPRKDATGDRP
jgi:WD40 repeat protein/serine/threonine protein kinase